MSWGEEVDYMAVVEKRWEQRVRDGAGNGIGSEKDKEEEGYGENKE